jgi:hypothetical protein
MITDQLCATTVSSPLGALFWLSPAMGYACIFFHIEYCASFSSFCRTRTRIMATDRTSICGSSPFTCATRKPSRCLLHSYDLGRLTCPSSIAFFFNFLISWCVSFLNPADGFRSKSSVWISSRSWKPFKSLTWPSIRQGILFHGFF